MTFEEWGAQLRAEREKRHFSIDDVADELKINPRQIRALEEGDVASLPHKAYVKGFIRSYAAWLGMSPQEIHDGLENTVSSKSVIAPEPTVPVHDEIDLSTPALAPKESSSHKGLALFALLCAIAGGIYFAWDTGAFDNWISRFMPSAKMEDKVQNADTYLAAKDQKAQEEALLAEQRKKDEEAKNTIEQAAQVEAEKSLPLPGNNNGTVIAPIPAAVPNNPVEQASAGIQAAKSDTIANPQTVEPEKTEPAADQTPPGQHKLIITATEECWVHSNADKTDTRQFSLRKGDTFAFAFSKSLDLKLGNAGGVTLRYDGVDLPAPGTSGQVKTIRFPPPENQNQ